MSMKITPENIDDVRAELPIDQGDALEVGEEIEVIKFPTVGGQSGTLTLFFTKGVGALAMGADSEWGDLSIDGEKLYLFEDAILDGWYINVWTLRFEHERLAGTFSIVPAEAEKEAEAAGRDWARYLDPDEIEDYATFTSVVANANAPEFPDFPFDALADIAIDAAWEEVCGD